MVYLILANITYFKIAINGAETNYLLFSINSNLSIFGRCSVTTSCSVSARAYVQILITGTEVWLGV